MTVTRGTDPWTLCGNVRERLALWLQSGTTTIEAKTGYHLTRDGELADVRMLRSLEEEPGMPRVHVTFMAALTVPPEFFGRRSDYIDAVCVVRGRRRRGRGQRGRRLRGRPVRARTRPAGSSTRAAGPDCCRGCTPAADPHRRGTGRGGDGMRARPTC